jgi:hypothetical protein
VIRFWSKVEKSDERSCWNWKAGTRNGYGRLWLDGGIKSAHRVAWEFTNGPIPDGLRVLHRCDNPSCCNPAHLFLGTQEDNVADMVSKGRQRSASPGRSGGVLSPCKGTKNGRSKLTTQQIEIIRGRASAGEKLARIARDFGVSDTQVRRIHLGHQWRAQ